MNGDDQRDTEIPEDLRKLIKLIKDYPQYYPHILNHISTDMENFKRNCENRNNILLREALGDAVHILGMKKRLSLNEMKRFCTRIKDAIFPYGINAYHHEGEKNFYERYLK